VISWRYHVVSLVAVVLAFGLGILAGTSVVGEGLADQLQRNYNEAVQDRDDALATVGVYERFAEGLQPTLRDGVLLGRDALVLTMEGIERPARRAVDELTAAGVDVLATLEVTSRLVATDTQANARTIQSILSVSSLDAEALREQVADALAVRLVVGPEGDQDVLGRLLAEGLVTADRDLDANALLDLGGGGQLVVVAAGGDPTLGIPGPQALLVPLTERLVALDAPAVVVGPSQDQYGFVAAVRDESGIPDCSLVTVDDIDLPIGGIALAMGVDRFLDDPDPAIRPGGDYGLAGDGIVPGAQEVPGSCLR
jgi:copper transport outer membrane protein MctB